MNSIQGILKITQQNRKALGKLLNSYSIDQINQIPSGFNNNVYWNIAHVISVQQFLIFKLSGNPYCVPVDFVKEFSMGTKPTRIYNETDIKYLKKALVDTYARMIELMLEGNFKEFESFSTAINFEITDLASALSFNQYHEALHMGTVLCFRKFI